MSALWTQSELQAVLGVAQGWDITGIAIDSRLVQKGDLFVALQGERDGHDYVESAFARGAAAALVSRPVPGRVMLVPDTLRALESLARAARARSGAKAVAVTGSVGKTTAKEMLRRTLSAFGVVHAAEASFNNHIGVPLTLARMPRDVDFGVFEIGMNHPGEIAPLAALVRPDVGLITCVDRAHLGLMKSEQAIAREKASLYTALGPGGKAVLPGDSVYLTILREAVPAGHSALVFNGPEARLLDVVSSAEDSEIAARVLDRTLYLSLAAPGRHMASNALGVLTVVAALGLDLGRAASALSGFVPYAGRGARRFVTLADGRRILLLDESYNASGASMRAALAVLGLQAGRHIAVLGDMLELGDHARAEHLALLPAVRENADLMFAAGPCSGLLFEALPAARQGAKAADAAGLAPLLQASLRDGDAVLVKGSFGSRMRDVIAALEGVG